MTPRLPSQDRHAPEGARDVRQHGTRPPEGRAEGPAGAAGPGLVSSRTRCPREPAPEDQPATRRPDAVVSVTVYAHDMRLRRMARGVRTSAELIQAEAVHGGRRCKAAMVTLTYAEQAGWDSNHVRQFCHRVRKYLKRRGVPCCYVWVLELTQAGRPHYHVLFWLPRGITLPKPDKRGWWPHGSTRIEWARSAVGYLAKYASKGFEASEVPKGARISGAGGLSAGARAQRAWQLLPAWVRELFTVEDRAVRAKGGGWMSRLTGAFEAARWRLADRAPDWSWLTFEAVEVAT